MKLTKNFSLKEALEWYKVHGITGQTAKNLKTWIERELFITPSTKVNIKNIAEKLQEIRDLVNIEFPEYKGDIAFQITSWFRPIKWELFKGRSGASQHTTGHGVDFIVSNVNPKDVQKIMDFIWKHLEKTNWNGGLAQKKNKNGSWSFIHIDLGKKRRWTY